MRLAFAGTPEFARVGLERLHAAGHEIALVLCQPDRPAGRGMKIEPAPVKAFALAQGLAVAQPRGLRLDGRFADDAAAARAALVAAAPEAIVVAAYGLILPPWLLELPRLGCINIHASLLPRWRGAAPIQRAIEAGDAETGVTLMQMDAGLDTGAILLIEATPIAADDTSATLLPRLAALGGELAVRGLADAAAGRLQAAAAAGGRRHLRRQDRQGRGDDRLAPAGGSDRAAAARLRSVSGRAQRSRRRDDHLLAGRGSPAFRPAPPGPARSLPRPMARSPSPAARARSLFSSCSVPAAGG